MSVVFESRKSVSHYLDPRREFAPAEKPIDIRVHPLTGHTTRVAHFGIPPRQEYVLAEEIKAAELPVFAPPLVTQVTPKFTDEGLQERYTRGRCVLFPNLSPYDELSPVATIGDRPLVEPNDLVPEDVADALALMREFFRDVRSPRDRGVLGWNFWPASGSSIPHPHIQAVASGRLPDRQRAELLGEERHHVEHESDFWDDFLAVERDGPRWLGEMGGFAAVADFAPMSLVPETVVVPVGGDPWHLQEATDAHLFGMAAWMCRLAAAHTALGVSSFNGLLHPTAPGDGKPSRFRARFIPRVYVVEPHHSSDWTWIQMGTNEGLTSIVPEEWAESLRKVLT
ncbi:MAG: hypothetical protein OXK16_15725 [bacterium]|nr:hypothetical protein [bacterium]